MIKGHTIVELTDVNTGKIERYEDDNMVTNAIQNFIVDSGMIANSPAKNGSFANDPIKTALGGILLLDENITENANNMVVPGGVGMIANGAAEYVGQGSDGVTEFGSWNYTESGWTADGKYKLVWDWAREHGNGTIKCICLTSQNYGYIGVGNINATGATRSSKKSPIFQTGSDYPIDYDTPEYMINRLLYVDYTNSVAAYVSYYNVIYSASHSSEHISSTGKLKVKIEPIPLTGFDIRMTSPYNNTASQEKISITEREITLPSAFLNALGANEPYCYGKFGDYYYLTTSVNLQPGETAQGVRIKLSDFTVQSFTITNTSNTAYSTNNQRISFGNGRVAFYTGTKMVFQDIFNNADTSEVECSLTFDNIDGYGNAFIREDSWMLSNPYVRVDMVAKTVRPTNSNGTKKWGRFIAKDNPLIYNYTPSSGNYSDGSRYFRICYCNDYIATINNLESPITKTSDKTMKVTYILSFS